MTIPLKHLVPTYLSHFRLPDKDYHLEAQLLNPCAWQTKPLYLLKELCDWHTHEKLKNTHTK